MKYYIFTIIYCLLCINNVYSTESITLINKTGINISLYYSYETVDGNILMKETNLIKNGDHEILYEQCYSSANTKLFKSRGFYVPYRPKELKKPLKIFVIYIYTVNKVAVEKYTTTVKSINNIIISMLGNKDTKTNVIVDKINTNYLEVNPQFLNQTNGGNYIYTLTFDSDTDIFSISEVASYRK